MPHAHDSPRAGGGAAGGQATLADVAAVARTRRARRGGCCLLFPAVALLSAAALVAGAVVWAIYTPRAIDATRLLLRLLGPQSEAEKPLPPFNYADPTKWTNTFEGIVVGIATRAQVGGMAAVIALAGVAVISAVLTVAGGVAERRSGVGTPGGGGGNCCSSLRAAAGAHGALALLSWLALVGFVALFALYAAWLGSAVVGDAVLGASGAFAGLLEQAAGGAALADAAVGGGGAAGVECAPGCVPLLGEAAGAADALPSAFVFRPVSSPDPAVRCMCAAAGLAAARAASRAVARSAGPALAGVALLAAAASWLYGGSTAGCARTGATAEMALEWDKMAAEAEAVAAAGGGGNVGGYGGYSGPGGTGMGGDGALEGRAPGTVPPAALGGGGFNGSYTYEAPPYAANGNGGGLGWSPAAVGPSAPPPADEGGAAALSALRRAVTGTNTPRYG